MQYRSLKGRDSFENVIINPVKENTTKFLCLVDINMLLITGRTISGKIFGKLQKDLH